MTPKMGMKKLIELYALLRGLGYTVSGGMWRHTRSRRTYTLGEALRREGLA
jgi:hypothetical protein